MARPKAHTADGEVEARTIDALLPSIENIHILIAEDTPMGCHLLKDVLCRAGFSADHIFCVVTYAQATKVIRESRIDVALISEDLKDSLRGGLRLLGQLRESHPKSRSIVLLRNTEPEDILEAFRNGAKGVLSRSENTELLTRCIAAVHRRQIWVNSEQLEIILQALVNTRPVRVFNADGVSVLSKREQEVGALVADGLTNREVAQILDLTEHTVGNYLCRIYEKLGLSTRVEFVLYVLSQRQRELNASHGL